VHDKDDGQAAEHEDEDSDEYESVDGNDIVVGKAVPRTNGTIPGENGYVEKHVDGGLEGVVLRLEAEPIAMG